MDVRKDFPILKRGIYFDNSATSHKPKQVLAAVFNYYNNHNANIHRGIHRLSEESSERYEDSKKTLSKFIGAKDWKRIVYVKNATEGLNLASHLLNLSKKDKVVITSMEHHSNILPWRVNSQVSVVDISSEGVIDIEDFKSKIKGAKVVSMPHASNVLGTINEVELLTKMAHEEGAKVVIDAAQSAPHLKVDVNKIGADFLAISGHKMLAPGGTGLLYVSKEFSESTPFMLGGGTVFDVTNQKIEWADMPERFEGGTPNIGGAIGFARAAEYLMEIGMDNVRKHEVSLLKNFFKLNEEKLVEIYGPHSLKLRTGLVSFNLPGVHSHDVADFLNARNIFIRSGKHCAHPLHERLCIPSSARASFYIYNTLSEVENLFEVLNEIKEVFS